MIEALAMAVQETSKEMLKSSSTDLPSFANNMKEGSIQDFAQADLPVKGMGNGLEKGANGDAGTRSSFLPLEYDSEGNLNGQWEGERGDSKWVPNTEKVPGKSNPEGKTWGEILDEYDIDGIEFNEGEPDFSPVSKGRVEIDDFTESRDKNFAQADEAEAKRRGTSPDEIKQWRQENGYTWHERSDCKTMDLVPSEVHNNIPHSGGISEMKKQAQN